jgi:hypothetical protein
MRRWKKWTTIEKTEIGVHDNSGREPSGRSFRRGPEERLRDNAAGKDSEARQAD